MTPDQDQLVAAGDVLTPDIYMVWPIQCRRQSTQSRRDKVFIDFSPAKTCRA